MVNRLSILWNRMIWAPVYLRFKFKGNTPAWGIVTHLTRAERLLLYHLALNLQPGAKLLEVGSYLGASACFLAAAAQDLGGGESPLCGHLGK